MVMGTVIMDTPVALRWRLELWGEGRVVVQALAQDGKVMALSMLHSAAFDLIDWSTWCILTR